MDELCSTSKKQAICQDRTHKFSTSGRASSVFKTPDPPKHDPEKGDLVYIGTLVDKVRLVKTFSLSTSIMGVIVQPLIFSQNAELPLALKLVLGGTLSFFIFLTPLLLHIITKRYITSMYYNQDTAQFTVETLSIFVTPKTTVFRPTQVTVPDIPGMFTTFKVDGKPLFLDPTLFLDRDVYIRLMGYDKPIDWNVSNHNTPKSVPPSEKN